MSERNEIPGNWQPVAEGVSIPAKQPYRYPFPSDRGDHSWVVHLDGSRDAWRTKTADVEVDADWTPPLDLPKDGEPAVWAVVTTSDQSRWVGRLRLNSAEPGYLDDLLADAPVLVNDITRFDRAPTEVVVWLEQMAGGQ